MLVIGGEFDRGRPPRRVEPIAQAIPGAQFKVLPIGHYAGLQAPELMAREIAAFLDSVGRSSPLSSRPSASESRDP